MLAELDFSGRAAVVTGAASGIGRATAKIFCELGAHVYAVDIDAAGLDALAREMAAEAKAVLKRGTVDLSLLDREIDGFCTKLLMTMPDCLIKTIESVRKHKLAHWDRNRETNRAWLSLNMMTEANAGFRAFNEGDKESREVDFVALRRRLAEGERWSEELIQAVHPRARRKSSAAGPKRDG